MNSEPATRESLLIRLRDAGDATAWNEFVSLYRPIVERITARSGLQSADSDEVVQQVMIVVAKAIGDWRRDPARGGFRAWLRVITRNAIVNLLQRGTKDRGMGGMDFEEASTGYCEISQLIEEEYARGVLRLAATRVRKKVQGTTWEIFWRTTIDQESPQQVADDLEFPVGKIYGARCRVMKLLQQALRDLELEDIS